MTAGDRASEQSRIAAERVERLRKELAQAERSQQAWERGAEGEVQVAKRLKVLELSGWTALHDTHWPGRPKANIDHVLIGPGGVVVIDSKNWSGDVQVRDGVLRQNGYRRDKETTGLLGQCSAIAAIVDPEIRKHVRGSLCMLQQPTINERTADGAFVLGIDHLATSVSALPMVLDSVTVARLVAQLRVELTCGTSPQLLTTSNVYPLQSRPSKQYGMQKSYSSEPRRSIKSGSSQRRPNHNSANRRRKRTQQKVRRDFARTILSIVAIFFFANVVMGFVSSLG